MEALKKPPKPTIWLSTPDKGPWREIALDEQGTLNISGIAAFISVRPETLMVGKYRGSATISIADIRSTDEEAGSSEESAVIVSGTPLPVAYAEDEKGSKYADLLRIQSEGRNPEEFFYKALSDTAVVAALKRALQAPAPDEVKDRSEAWIRHMLLPQLPELPKNKADLTKVLFPEQHLKLPVPKEFYKVIAAGMSELAAEFLIEADGSRLPSAVGTFLLRECGHPVTEIETSFLVGGCFYEFFPLFKLYSKDHFQVRLSFNCTEKQRHSHSETTVLRTRPDTIAVASGCTFLVGEDKVADLHAAEADLRSKIKPLNPMFYGELKFILGYIAAGTEFQWIYIGKNGYKDMCLIGRRLDLSNISDRCYFLLSVSYAFQLLKKMADSVPDVPGRRAMFSEEESSDKRRIIYFYADKVVKHIRDFFSHSAGQRTSLSEIQRAYAAAKGCRFLLQAVTEPTVSVCGTYRVQCIPLGYACSLKSEQDCRWMAKCVCQALCILHNAGLVHRDIRLPNIVRLSETDFMLIDLESVADSPFRLGEGFQYFSGWNPKMFEGNQYTPFSDMYSLGELLDAELSDARTPRADEFIRKLTDKQLSASHALQDPWLSELML